MNMQETEADILNDLEELGDPISRYIYLIACAKDCAKLPDQYRRDEYLIPECQVKTWLVVEWIEDKCYLHLDSESFIVKGALALLQEIYHGRMRTEVSNYHCRLPEYELFASNFTSDQINGISKILSRIENSHVFSA